MYYGWYKLVGKTPVKSDDLNDLRIGTDEWRVAKTDLPGDVFVSTVFLGLDHGFGRPGPPILFETMVFGGPMDDYQERYATWDEAEAGHERIVALARRNGLPVVGE